MAKSKKTAPAKNNESSAVVRMYNVGFGDAFLLLLQHGSSHRKVLFDCGSLEAAPSIKLTDVVDRILEDVKDPYGVLRIDVVVATHRHKDHVSGFADPRWRQVEVGEVWMPWTEHPTDPEARRIRNAQSSLALALQQDFALGIQAGQKDLERYQVLVENALFLANDKAMTTLHHGFAGSPVRRFLPALKTAERSFSTDVLPEVTVYVLGPSWEREVIQDLDPPLGESYLRFGTSAPDGGEGFPAPFPADLTESSYRGEGTFTADERSLIKQQGAFSNPVLAATLDNAINGTSLMLVLEVAGTYFLFPGDAQWGTWHAAMQDPQWKDLLQRTAFYKVGHHGSSNATPKEFVENLIPAGMWSMASTLVRSQWPDTPKAELLKGLSRKGARIARSDKPKEAATSGFSTDEDLVVEVRIPL